MNTHCSMISSGSLEKAEPAIGAGADRGLLKSSLEYNTPLAFIFRVDDQQWSVPTASGLRDSFWIVNVY